MDSSIINKLKALQERHQELEFLLNNPEIIQDRSRFRDLSKEHAQLSSLANDFQKWLQVKEDTQVIETLIQDLQNSEMRDTALKELQTCRCVQRKLEQKIQQFLLPNEPDDHRGCFLEIRAGTGGREAALFAGDLFRMYSRFAEARRWNTEIISTNSSEHGGFKEIIAKISDQGAYGMLKFESGGHRVQRIPATELQGRIHTSTCTVAVIPEIPDSELPSINPDSLRIDTFRSSGAGGQHVNTTNSAIRITHIPTGLVVACQDERSQHKNKIKALSVLGARLRAAELHRRQEKQSSTRRHLLGSGDRTDRIRTYNFQQGRVTDHRINLTLYTLEEIIEGKLEILIQSIQNRQYNSQSVVFYE